MPGSVASGTPCVMNARNVYWKKSVLADITMGNVVTELS